MFILDISKLCMFIIIFFCTCMCVSSPFLFSFLSFSTINAMNSLSFIIVYMDIKCRFIVEQICALNEDQNEVIKVIKITKV